MQNRLRHGGLGGIPTLLKSSGGWSPVDIDLLTVYSTSDTTQVISAYFTSNGEDGISVEYSLDGLTNWTLKGTSETSTFNATGLTEDTKYYWRARIYKGAKFGAYSNIVNDTTFVVEYAAVYAEKTYKPDNDLAAYENGRVKALKVAGFWAEMDVIRVWSGHSEVDSMLNWKDPENNVGTYNLINGPYYEPFKGWTGALTGSRFINHNYNPRTGATKFLLNSASMGFYSFTDLANDVATDMGARDSGPTNRSKILAKQAAGNGLSRMNQDGTSGQVLAMANTVGLISTTRNVAGIAMHHKKNHSAVQARTLTNVPNQDIYSLAYNNNGAVGGQSSRQQGFAYIGGYVADAVLDSVSDIVDEWMAANIAYSTASDWSATGLAKGGVVLQFYDYFVDSWLAADAVLSTYGWKATFLIADWKNLTQPTKDKVLQLQTAGHEIANHTYDNIDYDDFIAEGGTDQEYIDDHIVAGITAMEADGVSSIETFGPVGYNLPLSVTDKIFNETSIKNIPYLDMSNYDNSEHFRSCYKQSYKRVDDKMLYKSAEIIDIAVKGYDMTFIMNVIEWARDNNEIIILCGHEIVDGASGANETELADLVTICDYIQSNGMGFYSVKELNPLVTRVEIPKKPYSGIIGFGGTLEVGETLSYSVREEDDRGLDILIKEYQWWRADDAAGTNKAAIAGATAANYLLDAADEGKYIRCGSRLSTGRNIGYWSYTKWFGPIIA